VIISNLLKKVKLFVVNDIKEINEINEKVAIRKYYKKRTKH